MLVRFCDMLGFVGAGDIGMYEASCAGNGYGWLVNDASFNGKRSEVSIELRFCVIGECGSLRAWEGVVLSRDIFPRVG